MADPRKPDGAGVPGVNPELRQNRDPDFDSSQDGSVPLDTVSVRQNEERNVWPAVWAITTIVLVLITLYLLFGD